MNKLSRLTLSAAGLVLAGSAQAVTVFNDTYDTADTGDLNSNIASRQAAGTTTSAYTTTTGAGVDTIEGNQWRRDGGGPTQTVANFASSIGANDFSISTDLTMTNTSINWTSISLISANEVNRGQTDVSFLLRGNDNLVVSAFSGNIGFSKAAINAISGLGSWDANSKHNYKFVATATDANTGNFDFQIDGISIKGANTFDYVFTESTTRGIFWVSEAPTDALFDNVTLDVVPEPSVALLGGLGFLGLLRRRRA